MKSFSQAGQDVWVRLVLGNKPGTFIDIGCAGEQYSNTLALEQEGWTGWLVDIDPNAGKGRTGTFIHADATTLDWSKVGLPPYIDYLSLDVDENSLKALQNLPLNKTRFGVITAEHDQYQRGDRLRPGMRDIFSSYGYYMICKDVCGAPGAPFEDWLCQESLWEKAKKFATNTATLYSDILKGYL